MCKLYTETLYCSRQAQLSRYLFLISASSSKGCLNVLRLREPMSFNPLSLEGVPETILPSAGAVKSLLHGPSNWQEVTPKYTPVWERVGAGGVWSTWTGALVHNQTLQVLMELCGRHSSPTTSGERREETSCWDLHGVIVLESWRTQKEKVAMEYLDVTKIK